MKVFFQLFGQRKGIGQMFDEEEPKKTKPIDLDDLSVEEIEEMIGNHKSVSYTHLTLPTILRV